MTTERQVDAVLAFIATVELHYPRPKFNGNETQEEAWVQDYIADLGGYAPHVLKSAARHIRRSRDPKKDSTTFPKPRECIDACNHVAAEMEQQQQDEIRRQPLMLADPKVDQWSDDRINLAFDICKTELGRRAVREGWISGLIDYARSNARLPAEDWEVSRIIDQTRATDAWLRRIDTGDGIHTNILGALRGSAAAIRARRAEHAKKVSSG